MRAFSCVSCARQPAPLPVVMVVVVIMVTVLMRFMDVVCSVIIICLCCMPILVKVSALPSQFIFNFATFPLAGRSRCSCADFAENSPQRGNQAVDMTAIKHYLKLLTGELFFDIMQQTMQHCRVALLKKTNALFQPVDHFDVVVDAQFFQ